MTTAQATRGAFRDPKTKAELLDRMMMRDFTGDITDLAEGRNLRMERVRPHVIRLTFLISGQSFDLTVHKPRQGEAVKFKKGGKGTRVKSGEAPAVGESPGEKRQTRAGPSRKAA